MTPRDIINATILTKDGKRLYHRGWRPRHPMAKELTATMADGSPAYQEDEGGWHQLSFTPDGRGHWWRHSLVLESLVVQINAPGYAA